MRLQLPLALACALTMAACAAPAPVAVQNANTPAVSAKASNLVTVKTRLNFRHESKGRKLMAASTIAAPITPSNVKRVDVYMTEDPNFSVSGWTSLGEVQSLPFSAPLRADGTVSFANLKRGGKYTIVAVASGTNPLEGDAETYQLNNPDLQWSTATLNIPADAYEQEIIPTTENGLLTDNWGNSLAGLPLQLKDVVYSGNASLGLNINSGAVVNTEAPTSMTSTGIYNLVLLGHGVQWGAWGWDIVGIHFGGVDVSPILASDGQFHTPTWFKMVPLDGDTNGFPGLGGQWFDNVAGTGNAEFWFYGGDWAWRGTRNFSFQTIYDDGAGTYGEGPVQGTLDISAYY